MARPSKSDIKANEAYLNWDDYQKTHKSKVPLFLPISINLKKGIIERHRIKSDDVGKSRKNYLKEFKIHCDTYKKHLGGAYKYETFKTMLDEYIKAFEDDTKQAALRPGPLDFTIKRPVWFLFYLPRTNWTFSPHQQYSMENDRDDHMRNCEKVCTLDDGNVLLLANNCRSMPENLKYNLHVTIEQKMGSGLGYTDIIIDPGMDNDIGSWP